MKTIEQLEKSFLRARAKLQQAEEEERNRVSRPILRKSVGKCFKYLNSYGGSDPKWWYYVRIVGFDEKNMRYTTVNFQHTSWEHIEIYNRQEFNFNGQSRFGVENGWFPITLAEYNREQRKVLKTINRILQAEGKG